MSSTHHLIDFTWLVNIIYLLTSAGLWKSEGWGRSNQGSSFSCQGEGGSANTGRGLGAFSWQNGSAEGKVSEEPWDSSSGVSAELLPALNLPVWVEWTFGYSGNRKQAWHEKLWRLRKSRKGWQRLSGKKEWRGLRENRMERLCKWEVVMGKMAEDKGVAVCLLQNQILWVVISLIFFSPIPLKT